MEQLQSELLVELQEVDGGEKLIWTRGADFSSFVSKYAYLAKETMRLGPWLQPTLWNQA